MRRSVAKKNRPKTTKQDALAICAVALCFAITLSMCFILDGEGFLAAIGVSGGDGETYYLLCGGAYENIALARNYADLMRTRGGAGYVLADGERYEVILAVYSSSSDAEAALGASGMQGAYLRELTILNPSAEWAKGSEGAVVSAMKYFPLTYSELTSLSRGLSEGGLTFTDVRTRLDVLRVRLDEMKSEFYSATSKLSDGRYTEIKMALVTALALVFNVSFESPSGAEDIAYACASLRYQAVQLVMCRKSLGDALS